MRVCKMFVRALAGLVIASGMWVASAQAQTVTVSPTDLSFGVPTGTIAGRERAANGHRKHSR